MLDDQELGADSSAYTHMKQVPKKKGEERQWMFKAYI